MPINKILFVSLGCDKNLVDTEKMLGILGDSGFAFTGEEKDADIIIVNTCCFINDAKEESINALLSMAKNKESGNCKLLIATGCLAERYKDEITKEIPEVDVLIGTSSYDKIAEVIFNYQNGLKENEFLDLMRLPKISSKRQITTAGYYAHLKIAEGCNKHCTYCIIPKIRGEFRSVPMEELVEEASFLANSGVKELILVAQETTLYGVDIYGKKSLHVLLSELCKIEGIEWIRILYCYPEEIYDELIDIIAKEPKICNYLDMPIQHASDNILKKMGRKATRELLLEKINKLREKIPNISLRTTLITGFPGETMEDHEIMMEFVNESEFDHLGVFTYSPEENTPAALMDNQLDEEIKSKYRDEIMELQQEISFEKGQARVGKKYKVIIEGKLPDEDVYIGRTYMDAPEVDGSFFVECDYELISGEIFDCVVTEANEYDLIGKIV